MIDRPTDTHRVRTALRRGRVVALSDLKLDRIAVVYPGDRSYGLADHIDVVPIMELTASAGDAAGIFKRRRR